MMPPECCEERCDGSVSQLIIKGMSVALFSLSYITTLFFSLSASTTS